MLHVLFIVSGHVRAFQIDAEYEELPTKIRHFASLILEDPPGSCYKKDRFGMSQLESLATSTEVCAYIEDVYFVALK